MRTAVSMPFSRSSRQTSRPFLRGSIRSSRMRSYFCASALVRAESPSMAQSTFQPSEASRSEMVTTRPGSSSTKRIDELMGQPFRRCGNAQDEFAAAEWLAFDIDRATVRFDDSLSEAQAESGAVDLRGQGATAAEERVEDAALLVFGDAGPAIGDPNFDETGICRGGDANRRCSVFDRVLDQVLQDVLHRQAVGEDGRKIGREVFFEDDAVPLDGIKRWLEAFVDELLDADRVALADDVASFAAGEAKDLFN